MEYRVAVRTLCEFTARRGSLDTRFTPSPTGQEGMAGHQLVVGRRSAGYETEVAVEGNFEHLLVRGRADGYDPVHNRLDEIKTHRGDLARQPANHRHLHWAQAKVYGWLLCQARGLNEIELALVYFDIATQQETLITEMHTARGLQLFFETLCRDFLAWAQQEVRHLRERDESLASLAFPHPAFRSGQRELAEAVYRGAATGRRVMAQAPTGIGKTVGTIFPMLKAAAPHKLDKVFYLTAKSTGRQLALDAAALVSAGSPAMRLRVLELTARSKACDHPDKACHGDSCPLANGFYDRLPAARQESVLAGVMDVPSLQRVAQSHKICRYYLGQELASWADLVVGDYNYYFDRNALLHAMTLRGEWRVGVLADEAHNLVERGREMYSGGISQAGVKAVRKSAPGPVKDALDKINRSWSAMRKAHAATGGALDALPAPFLAAIRQATSALDAHFAQAPAGAVDGPLQELYFELLGFLRLAESFGSHSVLELGDAGPSSKPSGTLRIQNLIPAPFLGPRFASATAVTLFSATLSPPRYYSDMLGLPAATAWVDVASPFSADQLQVRVVDRISTRYGDRQRSAGPIAELIAQQFATLAGNYLAFFSSFEYLELVAGEFARLHPTVPAWTQSRGMSEAQRTQFLDRFVPGGSGVGFAVLGGSFGEGIDLRGDRLVGAFVATLGLPQFNARNEQLKDCLETAFGEGYDYTYLYPGIQKVVQAAGRVIRTQEDKGIIYLIDDRFRRRAVRDLLPAWWRITAAGAAATTT